MRSSGQLPTLELRRFKRTDRGPEMASATVRVAGHIDLYVRLLTDVTGNVWAGAGSIPGPNGYREVAHLSDEIREAMTTMLLIEYEASPDPRIRVHACSNCDRPIRFERGAKVDAETLRPHVC